jgi:hypothetical protein
VSSAFDERGRGGPEEVDTSDEGAPNAGDWRLKTTTVLRVMTRLREGRGGPGPESVSGER